MAGTKTEMLRLINDSGILNKKIKDLDKVTFDQMIMAIHKVQDNLGITGTTAKEAGETIQGSINSAKAAWQNLLTGMANPEVDTKPLVDKFVDSVKTVAKNLLPIVKTTISGLTDVARDLLNEMLGTKTFNFKGETVLRKMQESVKKVINTLEWFHKNKNLVGNAIKFMLAAFVVSKVNQWTKSLSGVTSGFLSLVFNAKQATIATNANTVAQTANTTAQVAGTGATKILTVATNALNAAWKANPIGLIVTGVTMLISLYQILKNKTEENTEVQKREKEELENQTARINDNKQAWDDLKASKQDQINTGMTEIAHYQNLYDELTRIVDANGKVKEGYEERASFIVSVLNEALGTEISITNGVIKKYGKLKDTIDEVISKKKAEIILNSQEELYTEAINNQNAAERERLSLKEQLESLDEERKKLNDELINSYGKTMEEIAKMDATEHIAYISAKKDIEDKIAAIDEQTVAVRENYNKQDSIVKEYAYNIGLYEKNMAAAHAGNYDQMSTVTFDMVKTYQKAGDAEKAQLVNQVEITRSHLNLLKELKERSNTDLYDSQIAADERQLSELQKQMKQYVSVTESGLTEEQQQWADSMAKNLTTVAGASVQFRVNAEGNVQAYIDGVASGEPKAKEEMGTLINNTIQEIKNRRNSAKEAGENIIEGTNDGISNERKQSSVFASIISFGGKLLGKLRESLQEHSPSKAAEQDAYDLFEGFLVGTKKKEGTVLNQIKKFGQDVLNTLNGELSDGVNTDFVNSLNGIRSGLGTSSSAIRNNSTLGTSQNNNSNNITNSKTNNFTQIINAPKQPSRIELYRQTRNLLELAKEGK